MSVALMHTLCDHARSAAPCIGPALTIHRNTIMYHPSPGAPLSWPELPDLAAVTLHDVLHDFVTRFESHYLGQIERYYRERSREHLAQPDFVQPDLFQSACQDDPPF